MDETLGEGAGSSAAGARRLALGPAASLVVLGLVLGLGIGWYVWSDLREAGGAGAAGDSARSAADLPGMPAGTLIEGVDVSNDPVLGPADAPVTIIEFSDFECPFCERFVQQTAPLLRRQYGDDIRWIFVNNPLQSIHPRAYDLALAGECAHAQEKFWEYYEAIFSGRFGTSDGGIAAVAQAIGLDEQEFDTCYREAEYAQEVADDLKEARKFYILGTPTFFINGRRLEGALPPEAFAAVIDSVLSVHNR
ncbi:MAG TPA: DsbA family protein [Gemmatimonadota bacterium]|nr:DsbA family protein [Gemmatimonadota bacterium]